MRDVGDLTMATLTLDIIKEVAAFERMTVGELQDRYVEVLGEPVRSRHRRYLVRRIAWRLQANAEGADHNSRRKRPPQRGVHRARGYKLPQTPANKRKGAHALQCVTPVDR